MTFRRLISTAATMTAGLFIVEGLEAQVGQTVDAGRVGTVTASAAPTASLSWAAKMFDELSHDFGTVARGAEVKHTLRLKNPYEETVRLVSLDKTCGCTAAKANFSALETGETGEIVLEMDTVKFMGEKKSNLLVNLAFEGGSTTQVKIPVRSYIRSDVVVQPGAADFGAIEVGAGGSKTLKVDYAGKPDWQIESVESASPHVTAEVVETSRVGGNVRYDLVVKVAEDAPMGTVTDRLVLKTNDEPSGDVPVLVNATVNPDIMVTPQKVTFGTLRPGERKTVNVVVRGKKPFRIDEVVSEELACFAVRLDSESTKPVHIIPLTIEAPDMDGDIAETFEVSVAGRESPLKFAAYGTVRK